jgi:hypothetical protein
MNEGEIVYVNDERCKVLVPLGSGHPWLAFAALRLSDGARVLIYGDGAYAEVRP